MTRSGADLLAQTLAENGVDTCFANPGTTEMHLLAALGADPRLTLHLCLFEGVATGAADGYARMAGRPAATLLHLGPGFANGMANLHNARKADSPVLNIVGEHATHHLAFDAPLTADIQGMAATVSAEVATPQTPQDIAPMTARLLETAATGKVCTLVVPNDVAWAETDASPVTAKAPARPGFDTATLTDAAQALTAPGGALMLGAACITRRMSALAHAIGQATGCRVYAEAAVARIERGGGTPAIARLPFHVDPATQALSKVTTAVLIGARDPVAFFAYPGRPSRLLPPEARVVPLCAPGGDAEAALEALAAELGVTPAPQQPAPLSRPVAEAPITAETLGQTVAAWLPEQAIVVDESITNGLHLFPLCGQGPAHDWMNNRGGSIGYSLPVAVGAAAACPERQVLTVTGDGSAAYTLQALWTMARAQQNVTVLILANRSYRILANESSKIGAGDPSAATMPLMSLENPTLDWVKLAEGHGVPARSVDTAGALAEALDAALAEDGPHLVEVRM